MNGGLENLNSLYEYYKSGDYFKAESGIRVRLERSPNDVQTLQLGALTALSMNQIVTAHERVDRATALMSMTAELANIRGRILKASGDWAAAEDAYNLAIELNPSYTQAKFNRLNLFVASEQPKRILEELSTDFDFGDVGAIAKVMALADLGHYRQALEARQSFKNKSYTDQQTFHSIKCFAGLAQSKKLEDAFGTLPKSSPLFVKSLNVVVNFFEMRGLRDKLFSILEDVAADCPASVSVQVLNIRKILGQKQNIQNELKSLLKTCPEDISVICKVADEARLEGRFSESCDLYQRALQSLPGDLSIMVGYAQAAISDNQFNVAQTLLQAALNQSPNSQLLLALVATLLRKMGREYKHLYDYKAFVRVYDIQPPSQFSNIIDFNKALKKKLDQLHIYKNAPINQTLRHGSQTELDLALVDDPILKSFFEAVDAPINDYIEHLADNYDHPLNRRRRDSYRISGAWSIRLSEDGHHVNHVHPMGWLSSAYYVDVPQSVNETSREGWIQFGQPNLNIDLEAEHFVQPKVGRLVLFPSYMWHGTIPFKGPDTRLTLPFDVVPA